MIQDHNVVLHIMVFHNTSYCAMSDYCAVVSELTLCIGLYAMHVLQHTSVKTMRSR